MCFNPWFNGICIQGSKKHLSVPYILVSILGLMESVFRGYISTFILSPVSSFNPWFNGICIQGNQSIKHTKKRKCFNPWFNGICIQGCTPHVTLLIVICFNPWFNGICIQGFLSIFLHAYFPKFQSLV